MKKVLPLLIILGMSPYLGGCAVALIGAGMGAAKAGNAKKSEAATKKQEAYSNYRVEMEKLNLEREKANLKPRDIMDFYEWAKEEPPAKKESPENISEL